MLFRSLFGGFRRQARLQAEIIALRHQLTVLRRTPYPKRLLLNRTDRWFWVWLSQFWSGWRSALIIVKPETVIGWHRRGFQCYWIWKTRHGRPGRPKVSKETRELIRTMSRAPDGRVGRTVVCSATPTRSCKARNIGLLPPSFAIIKDV
jgi:hypothetical protein